MWILATKLRACQLQRGNEVEPGREESNSPRFSYFASSGRFGRGLFREDEFVVFVRVGQGRIRQQSLAGLHFQIGTAVAMQFPIEQMASSISPSVFIEASRALNEFQGFAAMLGGSRTALGSAKRRG